VLLAASGCCRLGSSTAQRFRAKLIAHADPVSICFADAGLCPEPQPDSYRNSEGADAHQSQPYSKSNPNSDRDSDANAARLSRSECLADANASACIPLAVLHYFFETPSRFLLYPKAKPASFAGGFRLNC
jgi:hypothetical protein